MKPQEKDIYNTMNVNEQNLCGSYFNGLVSNKKRTSTLPFRDSPRLLRFKTVAPLPKNQNNVTSTRIEGPYLKTYESNNILPTPVSSFVESIYPLSELSNEIIQDINPFHLHSQHEKQQQLLQLPTQMYSSYSPSNFEILYNMNPTRSRPPEPKRNFEEEANNLTCRIMTGNLKTDHSDENYSNRLLIKQKITCVEDLIGKKRPKIKKPKPQKRPYRKRTLKNTEKTMVVKDTSEKKNDLQFLENTNMQMISQPSTLTTTNVDSNSDLKLKLDSTADINIDSLFENRFIESSEFQDSSPTPLDTPLDNLVNNTSLPMNHDVDLQIPSLSATSPDFLPLTTTLNTTPIDKTFDITINDIFPPKSGNLLLTPSSADDHVSLVDQLKNDRPLFEAISKKQKRGSYKCAHCPQTFPNLFEYAAHMDEFNIEREYKCPFALCPWRILGLPRRSDLRRHCAIQHKDELQSDLKTYLNLKDEAYPTILCTNEYCDKKFYRKDAFNRHVAIVHDNVNSRFNKKLSILLEQCPDGLTKEEQIKYVKENINKKITKTKSEKKKNK